MSNNVERSVVSSKGQKSNRIGIPQAKLRAAGLRSTGEGSLRLSQHIVSRPIAPFPGNSGRALSEDVQLSLTMAAMEVLEGRELMSASIGMTAGALVAQGDAKNPTHMSVGLAHHGKDVVVKMSGVGTKYFPADDVKSIALIGGSGNDKIVVNKAVTAPVTANAGDGNNVIMGGSGNEVLVAGNGDNRIQVRSGSDTVTVGDGNNVVHGGKHDDSIVAGNGNNVLLGSKGNDTIAVGSGKDMINAGAGDDSVTGGAGKNVIVGGGGNDTIVSGTGATVVRDAHGKGTVVRGSNTRLKTGRGINVVSGPAVSAGKTDPSAPTVSSGSTADPVVSGPAVSPPVVSTPVVGGSDDSSPDTTPPDVTPPAVVPPVVTPPVMTPPVVTPPVVAPPVVTPPVMTPPVVTPPVVAPPVVTPPASVPTTPNLPADVALTQTSLGSVNPGDVDFSGKVTKAQILASEPTGMAIHTVHFNGLVSKLAVGNALDTKYSWDFGDPGSAFNNTTGWIGAHTYQNAGVYTATLTIVDRAGTVSTTATRVTIAADTRRMIYVDSVSGSDANSGLTPDTAIATFARAGQLMGSNTELLFHNGQSFAVGAGMSISGKNVVIGSYGSGATARLVKGVDVGWSIFNIGAGSDGVVAQNLVFDSIWPMATSGNGRINARAFWVAGTNFTVQNSVFESLEDGVNTGGVANGVLIQGNYFSTQIRAYSIWGEGYDHVYIGNTMTGSAQEHLIRTSQSGVTRLVIEDNDLSRHTGNKGCLELRAASFFYVAGNNVVNGSFRFGLLSLPDTAWTGWGVAEGNQTHNIFVNVRPGVQHVAIRDNVINYDGVTAFNIETQCPVAGRVDEDIRIDHNTVINNSPDARFLNLNGKAVDISVTNNLMIAPNINWGGVHPGGIYVNDSDLSSFSTISNNVYPTMPSNTHMAGENYLSPSSGSSSGYVSAQSWENLPQVHNEEYANVSLAPNVYDVTLNGTTSGARGSVFNPAAWSIAAKAPKGLAA